MKNLNYFVITILFISMSVSVVFAQHEITPEETEATVPELFEFHDIIYPIWHNAYPEKDYEALRSYVDEVNEKAEAIYAAELPGILRDKKEKWNTGLDEFKKSVEDYNKAAEAKDDDALLIAAENLHTNFELLVRIIRPVTKEVDEFHKTLYVIYHQYLPNKNWEAIKKVSDELVKEAEAITNSELPARLEKKTDEYKNAADELLSSVKNLKEVSQSESAEAIEKAVENMHTKYQNLEAVFD